MLKIEFIAETPNDTISPLTIAHALIQNPDLSTNELEETANHLIYFVDRIREDEEEMQNIVEMYRKEHGLD